MVWNWSEWMGSDSWIELTIGWRCDDTQRMEAGGMERVLGISGKVSLGWPIGTASEEQ